jgi:low affinity Fe/Cu permease
MSTQPVEPSTPGEHLELPVEELLRRARPLPPHDEMVIEELTEEEGRAFLAALEA